MRDHRIGRRALMAGMAASVLAGAGKPSGEETSLSQLVAQVSADRLRARVEALAAFPTRWSDSPQFPAVEAHVAQAFGAPVWRQGFRMPSGAEVHNLIAGNPRDPRGIVLVGAHYDSISGVPSDLAPGANDNATGVAAMLEVHRLLAGLSGGRGLVCVAFAGEEQGFLGSQACADLAAAQGWRIDLMLNLDMLGSGEAPPNRLMIEFDQGNARADNDAEARRLGLRAATLAARHTTLEIQQSDIWGSDYMPFEAAGFPCLGLYDDGAEGNHYHSTTDTPAQVDFERLKQAARLAVAITADTLMGTG